MERKSGWEFRVMRQGLPSSTIFSLAADPPALPGRDPLGHAGLDAAMLVDGDALLPCAIRKLSAAGATIVLDALPEGDALHLDLGNGQSLPGVVTWTEAGAAGFLFDDPIDVIGTLARRLACLPAERRQLPRIEIHQTVSIAHDGRTEFTRSRNISQGGASIETRRFYEADDPVQISFDGLRPIDGVIKWASDGQAGIGFDEAIAWQVLMPWLRQVQQTPTHHIRLGIQHEPGPGLIPDAHAIELDVPARVREGVRWWNVRLRAVTNQLVEFETRASLAPGTQLWIALPQVGGAPASVIDGEGNRFVCEFRLPLRAGDIQLITSKRDAAA